MGSFRWISEGSIPANRDLRQHGWTLADAQEAPTDCILIVHAAGLTADVAGSPQDAWDKARRRTLVSGVNAGVTRARLLAQGFGEAVSDEATLVEVDARARRLHDLAAWLPRQRTIGELELDLFAREAAYRGRKMGLHPLEFALLWRLSEVPSETVSKQILADEIWGASRGSSSNSMAVQLSRLRAKLGSLGLANLIVTVAGGYSFDVAALSRNERPVWMAMQQACP
ncbi:DNA-binding winged helix-turn-helix (wHTH) protein [Novosphingobium chloroacetimidivorans]|uniref:DNA-binding winged helix-turn-helix (WHTH) protein n=1 Tax=Novosphingobium chloroacetimidivorans TaxID=1428314 RepID=A0A7W7K7W7_9SPHN|nr:winged helix-turn-helix domain-containing protein [Novosphingobium chloroacetimidivorans]MBB4857580.1 DNA-binding winged helix-turn-helix (wHTH) protein [Novosphingobium chloroacetimidivorans]